MSNIKGLYFKLNVDKPKDKFIYDFFLQAPENLHVSKIDILFSLVSEVYKQSRKGEKE